MNGVFLIFLGAVLGFSGPASPLIGEWKKDGVLFAQLRSDGTGRVDHDKVSWKADVRRLTLVYEDGTVETMAYRLKADTLTLDMDGETSVLTRASAQAPKAKEDKDSLAQLLLSTAWCHFRYNKVSGASHQERVVFRNNGTWSSGGRAESYSSGTAGSVAGQTDSADSGRWQVKEGALLLSTGGGDLEDAGLFVSHNSNGYPILKTGGKEYSSCE